MTRFEHYIFRRIFFLTLGTLVSATLIVLTTQVLVFVNVISSSGQSIATFFRLAAMLIPAMMVIVMPFALMLGAGQTLSLMNSDSELVVMEASGSSPAITARPVFFLAVLMSLSTLMLAHFVEPWSNRELRNILNDARGDLFSIAIQSGSFMKLEDNLHVQVSEKQAGGQLRGIFMSDKRDEEFELIYYAKQGVITSFKPSDLLVLRDGEVHRKSKKDGNVAVINFDTYVVDMSGFSSSKGAQTYFPKERSTSFLFDPDKNGVFFQHHPHLLDREIHRRFSEWLYPLAFGLLIVVFLGKASTTRNEQIWNAVSAGAIGLLVRGGSFVAMNNAENTFFAILMYALPLICISLCGVIILTGYSVKIPQKWQERATANIEWIVRVVQNISASNPFKKRSKNGGIAK